MTQPRAEPRLPNVPTSRDVSGTPAGPALPNLPQLPQLPELPDLQAVYNRVELYIEQRYGVPVFIADVIDRNTGDFDGCCIKVDYDQDLDVALFVLIHLFGHTVQWNLSEELRLLGLDTQPGKSEAELVRIYDYERDASRYGLRLLHELGVHSLDRWLTDFWYADWRFLEHFYRTGQRLDVRSLLRPGQDPDLTALPIPHFVPQRFTSRWSF